MTVVSVITPTYHAAKWVATTIDSVIAQTYPHLELIVVDDGSQGDTVSVVRRKLAANFRNDWKIIALGANQGPSAARNVGLTAANGSWVQFLDSDDLIPPTKFERQMAYCARAPDEVTAIYSPWRRCYLDDSNITWEGPLIEPNMEGRAPIMCLVAGLRPLHSAGLARRSTLEQVGGFDEDSAILGMRGGHLPPRNGRPTCGGAVAQSRAISGDYTGIRSILAVTMRATERRRSRSAGWSKS